jgi:hypothetical protein
MPDSTRRPSTASEAEAEAPNGGAIGVLLAAGIAAILFGVSIIAVDASSAVKTALTLSVAVGPLSGESIVLIGSYALATAILWPALARRRLDSRQAVRLAVGMVVLGLLLTFPPVYQLFAGG